MSAPPAPSEPTWLPSTALGWFALAMMGISILSLGVAFSGVLPGEARATSYFSLWQARMFVVWLATGVVGTELGISSLIRGDRSVTALLIAMIGIPMSFFMLIALAD